MKIIFLILFVICQGQTFLQDFHRWVQQNLDLLDGFVEESKNPIDAFQLEQVQLNGKLFISLTNGWLGQETFDNSYSKQYFTIMSSKLAILAVDVSENIKFVIDKEKANPEVVMFEQDNYRGMNIKTTSQNRLVIYPRLNEAVSQKQEENNQIIEFSNIEQEQFLIYILYGTETELRDAQNLFNFITEFIELIESEQPPKYKQCKPRNGNKKKSSKSGAKKSDKKSQGSGKTSQSRGSLKNTDNNEKQKQSSLKDRQEQQDGDFNKRIEGLDESGLQQNEHQQNDNDLLKNQGNDNEKNKGDDNERNLGDDKDRTDGNIDGQGSNGGNNDQGDHQGDGTSDDNGNGYNNDGSNDDENNNNNNKSGDDNDNDKDSSGDNNNNDSNNDNDNDNDSGNNNGDKNNLTDNSDEQGNNQTNQQSQNDQKDGSNDGDDQNNKNGQGDGLDNNEKGNNSDVSDSIKGDNGLDNNQGNDDSNNKGQGNDGSNNNNGNQGDQNDMNQNQGNESDGKNLKCVNLYSECYFSGDSVELCGSHAEITDKLQNFQIKSIEMDDGIEVSFFGESHFENQVITITDDVECLEIPIILSPLEIEELIQILK